LQIAGMAGTYDEYMARKGCNVSVMAVYLGPERFCLLLVVLLFTFIHMDPT
jgi:hypothetical protein